MIRLLACWSLTGACLCACASPGLEGGDAGPSTAEQWRAAQAMWEDRAIDAYDEWLRLDPTSPEGRAAHARLEGADAEYRRGIRLLAAGEDGAVAALQAGVRVAPMDPTLYLPLARACRAQGLDGRAKEYYRKYLAARPDASDAGEARAELAELPRDVFDPPVEARVPEPAPPPPPQTGGPVLIFLAAVGGAAFTLVMGVVVVAIRRRGVSLHQLARDNPELHPAIAYLVGSLRHELLKHRIGAVGDALRALERGDATPKQLAFLRSRLYGGEPLHSAWEGHLRAFERALGYRLDLRRDRAFARAGRAIRRIESLEGRLRPGDAAVVQRLGRAHGVLRAFDRDLAELVVRLVRSPIDDVLLDEVVDQVRSEYAPSQVALDDLQVRAPDEPVEVEVFRVDLVLILKNIVRNAVLAVGRAPAPRRIALDVQLDLEPTGEEVVRLRVRDTSRESLTTQAIYDRRVDRGLGLVTAALTRYDGAIEVEPGGDGYEKAVVVRFFRALDDESMATGRESAA